MSPHKNNHGEGSYEEIPFDLRDHPGFGANSPEINTCINTLKLRFDQDLDSQKARAAVAKLIELFLRDLDRGDIDIHTIDSILDDFSEEYFAFMLERVWKEIAKKFYKDYLNSSEPEKNCVDFESAKIKRTIQDFKSISDQEEGFPPRIKKILREFYSLSQGPNAPREKLKILKKLIFIFIDKLKARALPMDYCSIFISSHCSFLRAYSAWRWIALEFAPQKATEKIRDATVLEIQSTTPPDKKK